MRIIHVKYRPDALTALLASLYATRETQARDMLTAIGGQLLSINWTMTVPLGSVSGLSARVR